MIIKTRPVDAFEFRMYGEYLGLFKRAEKWNGLAKYTCLKGRFESEYLIVIDKEENFPAVFFTMWSNILNTAEEQEIVPVMGSPALAGYIDELLAKAKEEKEEIVPKKPRPRKEPAERLFNKLKVEESDENAT